MSGSSREDAASARRQPYTVLADDLTGAAEAAGVLHERYGRARLSTIPACIPPEPAAVALGIRDAPAEEAFDVMKEALAATKTRKVFLKVDSQLRGPLRSMLAAASRRFPIVTCTALPARGRIVRDGEVLVGGRPLHQSAAWKAEGVMPRRLRELGSAELPVAVVDLDVVRSADLPSRLASNARAGLVSACDAVTEEDLSMITRAASRYCLVGSSALLDAAAAANRPSSRPGVAAESPGRVSEARPGAALVVVGTMDPGARAEVLHTIPSDNHVLVHDPRERPPGSELASPEAVDRAIRLLGAGISVAITAAIAKDGRPRDLTVARRLAEITSQILDRVPSVTPIAVLGGETAQAVLGRLTRMERCAMEVRGSVHRGATALDGPGGRAVVLRPGSFTDGHSLSSILAYLTHPALR